MTDHGHSHAAVANTSRRRLAIAFAITVSVLISGVVGAVLTGSLALLVDAAHMLTDAGGLLVALMASILITRPVTARRTWGFQRAEVLAATAQGAVLLAVGLFVVIEGVQRLISPPAIASSQLLLFGFIGLLPCCGWLPYSLRPSGFLSRPKLAPRLMSILGGVENPKLLATLTRSSLCTSKTERKLCDA